MTVGIVTAFGGVGAVIALGPVFAQNDLQAPSTGFGILITAFGIGMGSGMGLMNVVGRLVEKDKLLYLSMFGAAACLLVLAASPSIWVAAVLAIPMGLGVGLAWVSGYTLLQENVTDEYRGRTFATLTVWARMTLFGALVAFPALSAAIGPTTLHVGGNRIALWLAGSVVVAAGMSSRSGMKRSRLARPRALALVPHVRRPSGSGLLIAFEGTEGAGKGTQIEMARAYLTSKGHDVILTREPGGTGFGDRLRDTLLDPTIGTIDPRAEALVFAGARAHLVTVVIRPALAEGKIVLVDRFIDSSIAYQGFGRGVGEQDVLTLNVWATQGLFPDLVVLLHLEPEEGLARGKDLPDRIEQESLAFHARVTDAYLKIADEHPDRFHVVDARGTPEEVQVRVREGIDRLLAEREQDRPSR